MNRKRSALVAALAAQVLLAASCSPRLVKSFAWTDSGKTLAFSQSGHFPKGREGALGPGREANRYIPAQAIAIGETEALELRANLSAGAGADTRTSAASPARLRLAACSRGDGSEPIATGSFEPPPGRSALVLPLPAGASIASLSVELEKGSGSSLSIESITAVPSFRGYESGVSGERLSAGFSRKSSRGVFSLEIAAPFAGLPATGPGGARPGIILSYSGAASRGEFRVTAIDAAGASIEYRLLARPGGARTCLGSELFPAETRRIALSLPAGAEVSAFKAGLIEPEEAELADLGRILLAPADASHSDYQSYRWDLAPGILILDFRDYAVQDRYLRRMAFYVEKAGFRGKLLSDAELAGRHGYNAHDYRCEDLAAFFEAARKAEFPLLPEERALAALLLSRGLLRRSGEAFAQGEGALLSISRESSSRLRRTLLVHESTHGLFFVDAAYRDFASSSWKSVGEEERWFWKTYLGWAAYDTSSEYLMANEFQAYLLQQALERVREYFVVQKAEELVASRPALKPRVEAYMARFSEAFESRAAALGAWLEMRYGGPGGRAILLERLSPLAASLASPLAASLAAP